MRILHILDHSAPLQSGYVFRTLAILRQQRALGWETIQLTGPKHPSGQNLTEVVEELTFHRTKQPDNLLFKAPILRQIAVISALKKRILEVATQLKPDLLHAHSPVLNGLATLFAGQQLGLPVVYEIRAFWEDAAASHGTGRAWGPRYRLTRALETYLLRQADAVTVICEGLRKEVISRGIHPDKVTTIPNAVEIQRFATPPDSRPVLPNFDTDGMEILAYIGSFYSYEGLSLLLDALPTILTKRPNVRLLLVGGGPEEERLQQQVSRMGLTNKVCFTGRTPPNEATQYYAMADLLVYPRLPMRLTHLVTPLKPLEAMAARRLVLASDVQGHQELITHGQTGFLFRAGDATDLAQTTLSLLENRTTWDPIILQAEHFVQNSRNWPVSVDRYKGVYNLIHNLCDHTVHRQMKHQGQQHP